MLTETEISEITRKAVSNFVNVSDIKINEITDFDGNDAIQILVVTTKSVNFDERWMTKVLLSINDALCGVEDFRFPFISYITESEFSDTLST